jgi:hypothetical protein
MFTFLPQQLLVDNATVYRAMFSDILAMPKDGSAPQRVFAVGNAGPFLATNGEYLYWANLKTIQRQRKDGATITELVAQAGGVLVFGLAVTDTWAYFWTVEGQAFRAAATGGATIGIPGPQPSPVFAVDGDKLYTETPGGIVALADDGTVATVVAIAGASSLAVDARYVYWFAVDGIRRAPK